ncbi:hypothetical protein F4808DRAFT_471032, partial [Astrocystis sublimbata]
EVYIKRHTCSKLSVTPVSPNTPFSPNTHFTRSLTFRVRERQYLPTLSFHTSDSLAWNKRSLPRKNLLITVISHPSTMARNDRNPDIPPRITNPPEENGADGVSPTSHETSGTERNTNKTAPTVFKYYSEGQQPDDEFCSYEDEDDSSLAYEERLEYFAEFDDFLREQYQTAEDPSQDWDELDSIFKQFKHIRELKPWVKMAKTVISGIAAEFYRPGNNDPWNKLREIYRECLSRYYPP